MRHALLISCIFFLTQCTSSKISPSNYEKAMITFGSGGGFTGAVQSKTLLSNGMMFKKTNVKGEYEKLNSLSSRQVKQIFSSYDHLHLSDIDYNVPGNTYNFIEYKLGPMSKRITWGPNNDLPKEIGIFYQILNNL